MEKPTNAANVSDDELDLDVKLGVRRDEASDDEGSEVESCSGASGEFHDAIEVHSQLDVVSQAADERRSVSDNEDDEQGVHEGDQLEKLASKQQKSREPFDVPTSGAFYMHDDRFDGDIDIKVGKDKGGKSAKAAASKWGHDKFEQLAQNDFQPLPEDRDRRGGRMSGRGMGRRGRNAPISDVETSEPLAEPPRPRVDRSAPAGPFGPQPQSRAPGQPGRKPSGQERFRSAIDNQAGSPSKAPSSSSNARAAPNNGPRPNSGKPAARGREPGPRDSQQPPYGWDNAGAKAQAGTSASAAAGSGSKTTTWVPVQKANKTIVAVPTNLPAAAAAPGAAGPGKERPLPPRPRANDRRGNNNRNSAPSPNALHPDAAEYKPSPPGASGGGRQGNGRQPRASKPLAPTAAPFTPPANAPHKGANSKASAKKPLVPTAAPFSPGTSAADAPAQQQQQQPSALSQPPPAAEAPQPQQATSPLPSYPQMQSYAMPAPMQSPSNYGYPVPNAMSYPADGSAPYPGGAPAAGPYPPPTSGPAGPWMQVRAFCLWTRRLLGLCSYSCSLSDNACPLHFCSDQRLRSRIPRRCSIECTHFTLPPLCMLSNMILRHRAAAPRQGLPPTTPPSGPIKIPIQSPIVPVTHPAIDPCFSYDTSSAHAAALSIPPL